jgi:hypothetical protein
MVLRSDSAQPRSSPTQAPRDSGLIRAVNLCVRHFSELFDCPDPITLFCECRKASCHSRVRVTLSAFDAIVADGTGWLLVDGHTPSEGRHLTYVSAIRRMTRASGGAITAGRLLQRPCKVADAASRFEIGSHGAQRDLDPRACRGAT